MTISTTIICAMH